MIFQYDHETDMLYVKLVERPSVESEEVAPNIVLDFDEHKQVVGIEIENASTFIDLSHLEVAALPLVDFLVSERAPTTTGAKL